MSNFFNRFELQLFADGGEGGEGTAPTGESAPDAGEARLRELGVPEDKLARRRQRGIKSSTESAPRMTEAKEEVAAPPEKETPEKDESEHKPDAKKTLRQLLKEDPDLNSEMQSMMQTRLKEANAAQAKLDKLAPAFKLLTQKYKLGGDLDAEKLAQAILDDDTYYEDKAIEMGVDIATAKKIDKAEAENEALREQQARQQRQQQLSEHFYRMTQQAEKLKETVPGFDLTEAMKDGSFAFLTQPGGVDVQQAYFSLHMDEIIQTAIEKATREAKQQLTKAVAAGANRPQENGTQAQAPALTTFDWSKASKEQRAAMRERINNAAARGEKIYPGKW